MVAAAFIQSGYLIGNVINTYKPFFVYGESKLDTTSVVGAEYLPAGVRVETYTSQYALVDENVDYTQNYRNNNYIDCTLKNDSDSYGTVAFSIVYYDGYSAVDKATGDKLQVFGNEGRLCVYVPSHYSGDVIVSFTGFASWRIATVISIIAAVVFIVVIADRKKVIYSRLRKKRLV